MDLRFPSHQAFTYGRPKLGLAVLLVDGSEVDASLAATALEDSGYAPVGWRRVESAKQMETALVEESWDVVLCDHRMRGLDSSAALALLRARGLDIPLILVCHAIGDEATAAAMHAGAAALVSKDRLERLGVTVHGCIREAEERGATTAAESAERVIQRRFETSVETLVDPFALLRPVRDDRSQVIDFIYEYVNVAACDALALTREELVGMRVMEVSPELAPPRLLNAYATVVETGQPLVFDDFLNVDRLAGEADQRAFDLRASRAVELLALTWRNVTKRNRAENERSRLATIVRSSEDAIVSLDADLRIVSWNRGAEAIYGYSAAEVLGKPSELLIPPNATAESRGLRDAAGSGTEVVRYETERLCRDGAVIEVAITAFPLIDTAGNVAGSASIYRDITIRKQGERALAESEARYREILDTTPDGVWRVDAAGRTDYVNQRMASMLGYASEEMLGRRLSELIKPDRRARRATSRIHGRAGVFEECFVRKDGTPCWARVSQSTLTDQYGDHTGALAIMSDITAARAQAHELHTTEHLLAAVTHSMAEGMFAMGPDDAVMFMNRAAEQLLGWNVGDLANRSMHDILHGRAEDGAPCPRTNCPMLPAIRAHTTVRVDNDVFTRRDGRLLPVAYSAAPITAENDVSGTVVVFTDVSARRFEEERHDRELETLNWVGRIRDALDDDRLVLLAQPIIDLRSRAVVAHELLLRMVDRDGALIAPGRFLPAAEQFGLIEEIDRWVLGEAVQLASTGRKVHFNVSGKSIGSRALIDHLIRLLRDTGADPGLLVCEITETALATEGDVSEAFVRKIADLGCEIALDDFGMGYGGFAHLKRLPVTVLKIDKEFVVDLLENSENQHIVKATVNLARGFGRATIAEGVESAATLALLEKYGVDSAQGFEIGRPEPIEALLAPGGPSQTARRAGHLSLDEDTGPEVPTVSRSTASRG